MCQQLYTKVGREGIGIKVAEGVERPLLQIREEVGGDSGPFFFERSPGFGAARPDIPVAGVPEISFAAMKIRVNPGPVRSGNGLRQMVGFLPVPLPVVPEGPQQLRQMSGRLRTLERGLELLKRHEASLARRPARFKWLTAGNR